MEGPRPQMLAMDEIDQEAFDKVSEKIDQAFEGLAEKLDEFGKKMEQTMNDITVSLKTLPAPDENPMNVPKATIMKRRRQNKAARKARRKNR